MGTDLFQSGILLLDGAMGTVLQQRGLPPGGQPELLNLTDPALLRSVYHDFFKISTGANRSEPLRIQYLRFAPIAKNGAGSNKKVS